MTDEIRNKVETYKSKIDEALNDRTFKLVGEKDYDPVDISLGLSYIEEEIDEDRIENFIIPYFKSWLLFLNGFGISSKENKFYTTIRNNFGMAFEKAKTIEELFAIKRRMDEELEKRLAFIYDVIMDRFIDAYDSNISSHSDNSIDENVDLIDDELMKFDTMALEAVITVIGVSLNQLKETELFISYIEETGMSEDELLARCIYSTNFDELIVSSRLRLLNHIFDTYKGFYNQAKIVKSRRMCGNELSYCHNSGVTLLCLLDYYEKYRDNCFRSEKSKEIFIKKYIECVSYFYNNPYVLRGEKFNNFGYEDDDRRKKYDELVIAIKNMDSNYNSPKLETYRDSFPIENDRQYHLSERVTGILPFKISTIKDDNSSSELSIARNAFDNNDFETALSNYKLAPDCLESKLMCVYLTCMLENKKGITESEEDLIEELLLLLSDGFTNVEHKLSVVALISNSVVNLAEKHLKNEDTDLVFSMCDLMGRIAGYIEDLFFGFPLEDYCDFMYYCVLLSVKLREYAIKAFNIDYGNKSLQRNEYLDAVSKKETIEELINELRKDEKIYFPEHVYPELLPFSQSAQITKSETTKQSSGGCYVATAVYGSYDCPEVWTLRRYRDDILSNSWYGRLFIYLYYAISPTIVKLFGNTTWFKNMWRGKLNKMVSDLQKSGVESTPYEDKIWKKEK